jgi:hypothetical protein
LLFWPGLASWNNFSRTKLSCMGIGKGLAPEIRAKCAV